MSDEVKEFGERRFLTLESQSEIDFLLKRRNALKKAADGRALGGASFEKEMRLYEYVNEILKSGGILKCIHGFNKRNDAYLLCKL